MEFPSDDGSFARTTELASKRVLTEAEHAELRELGYERNADGSLSPIGTTALRLEAIARHIGLPIKGSRHAW